MTTTLASVKSAVKTIIFKTKPIKFGGGRHHWEVRGMGKFRGGGKIVFVHRPFDFFFSIYVIQKKVFGMQVKWNTHGTRFT